MKRTTEGSCKKASPLKRKKLRAVKQGLRLFSTYIMMLGIENPDLFLPYISARGRYGLDHPVFSAGARRRTLMPPLIRFLFAWTRDTAKLFCLSLENR